MITQEMVLQALDAEKADEFSRKFSTAFGPSLTDNELKHKFIDLVFGDRQEVPETEFLFKSFFFFSYYQKSQDQ